MTGPAAFARAPPSTGCTFVCRSGTDHRTGATASTLPPAISIGRSVRAASAADDTTSVTSPDGSTPEPSSGTSAPTGAGVGPPSTASPTPGYVRPSPTCRSRSKKPTPIGTGSDEVTPVYCAVKVSSPSATTR